MSRGQRPRTREHFPKMKIRGARRRQREEVVQIERVFERVAATGFEVFGAFAEAAAAASIALGQMFLGGIGTLFAGAEEALRRAEKERREYLGSERYRLDLIEHQHLGDPIAHLDAIAEFFAARAHRELDELLERLAGYSTAYVEIVPDTTGLARQLSHLDHLLVPPGSHVEAGTIIGRIGTPGHAIDSSPDASGTNRQETP